MFNVILYGRLYGHEFHVVLGGRLLELKNSSWV
jgi:hypothetical protein